MNGCPACDQLRADIAAAYARGDYNKAAVLEAVLRNHVCEEQPAVQWKNAVWTVKGY